MNVDARLKISFMTHPKRIKLRRKLGAAGVESLIYLWLWAAQNKPSGTFTGMDDAEVEIAAMWDGEPGAFVAGLVEVRFMDRDAQSGMLKLHDWRQHNPWASGAEGRSEHARVASRARWDRKNSKDDGQLMLDDAQGNARASAQAKPGQSPSNAECNAPSPSPSPPPSPNPKEGVTASGGSPAAQGGNSSPVWDAYRAEFVKRYGTDPVRNAASNSILSRIVKTVGRDEALELARFFVRHGNPYYAKRCHPLELLADDLQKLRTEWKTGGGGSAAAPADPALRAEEALRQRMQNAWGEVLTSARLGVGLSSALMQRDPIVQLALDEIGGMETLRRLPSRERPEKGPAFTQAYRRLANESRA